MMPSAHVRLARHRATGTTVLLLVLAAGVLTMTACKDGPKTRVFLLSGQSNMRQLKPAKDLEPLLHKAFPKDNLLFVKLAVGGQPVRRWVKDWEGPPGKELLPTEGPHYGDLYDKLLSKARAAAKKRDISLEHADSVTLLWAQGEYDANKELSSVYEKSLHTLFGNLRRDVKHPRLGVVIARNSDYGDGKPHWKRVREIQESVAASDPLIEFFDTDDLNGKTNDIHMTKKGYRTMGERFAKAAEKVARSE